MAAWVFGGCFGLVGGYFDLAARFDGLLDFHIRLFVHGFSFQVFDLILWVSLPFQYGFLVFFFLCAW